VESIEKYGDARSMSRLIEDLATGAANSSPKQPEACSILGVRSEFSHNAEADFKKVVEEITAQLSKIEVFYEAKDPKKKRQPCDATPKNNARWYFALKEACELELNKIALGVNECWSCVGLNGPLPTFPDAGKNFEIFATMNNNYR
jgi:hypothetical protein